MALGVVSAAMMLSFLRAIDLIPLGKAVGTQFLRPSLWQLSTAPAAAPSRGPRWPSWTYYSSTSPGTGSPTCSASLTTPPVDRLGALHRHHATRGRPRHVRRCPCHLDSLRRRGEHLRGPAARPGERQRQRSGDRRCLSRTSAPHPVDAGALRPPSPRLANAAFETLMSLEPAIALAESGHSRSTVHTDTSRHIAAAWP